MVGLRPYFRDLRLELDSATGARLRPFLQSVLVPPRREESVNCFEDTPNVPEFLKHDSPPRCLPSLDSPPLFPRITQGRFTYKGAGSDAKSGVINPIRVSDVASMLQVASPELVDGEDGGIDTHHMEVVSGWSEFKLPQWI
jgi:hypothetical protein